MQPTGIVRHPQHPEISVTVKKPTIADELDLRDFEERSRVPIAITAPNGKPIMDPETGTPYFLWRPTVSTMELNTARLRKLSTGWAGVSDGAGVTAAFTPANLYLLWEERYEVKLERCFLCDQASHPVEWDPKHEAFDPKAPRHDFLTSVPFGLYVNRATTLKETFDPDPSIASSARQ